MIVLKRILVIDDDEGITHFLRVGLTYEGYAVATAASGEEGLRVAREQPPDLVVLDWMLPELSGLEVLRRLKAVNEKLPVILLTGKDAPDDQVLGFETGADDYVLKPVHFEILLARIRARMRDQEPQPEVLAYADLRMEPAAHTAFRGSREIQLTGLEYRLLQLLVENPERVFSKSSILDRIWGEDFFGDPNVVEVYVKQLRQKLEAGGEPRLIQTIRGVGYVLRALPAEA
ncbi:Response regulator MprA [Calidithermus terrae]|uniref:Response regulator MprA n=1 Tax=Calidithermus terrae TaxID=1408545 RepID=A0A399F617_9DEIN|nr:response regulator transcription factor [Calidithermus terrae]RIH90322.1 Response regulator MprA [Calidithermus terrae]